MGISFEREVSLQGLILEILKLLVPISSTEAIIIDLDKVPITQILLYNRLNNGEFTGDFFSWTKYIKWSKDEKMLYNGPSKTFDDINKPKTTLLKYSLYNKQSL